MPATIFRGVSPPPGSGELEAFAAPLAIAVRAGKTVIPEETGRLALCMLYGLNHSFFRTLQHELIDSELSATLPDRFQFHLIPSISIPWKMICILFDR